MSYNNVYLPAQMSGPVAQGTEQAAIAEFSGSDGVLAYLSSLSIDNANADVLALIGEMVGLPWPTVPIGTYADNYLVLTNAAFAPQYNGLTGLGSVGKPVIGGLLSSANLSLGQRIDIGLYRQLLKTVAQIKQQGLSLALIDALVAIFTLTYTLSWNSFNDLVITFSPDLDTGSLYTLNLVLDLFMIDPIIVFVQT